MVDKDRLIALINDNKNLLAAVSNLTSELGLLRAQYNRDVHGRPEQAEEQKAA